MIRESANAFGSDIKELTSPFSVKEHADAIFYYKILLAVSFLSFPLNYRRIRLEHLFLYVAFMAFSTMARRNIAEFSMITAPIVIYNLRNLPEEIISKFTNVFNPARVDLIRQVSVLCLALLVMHTVINISTDRYYRKNRFSSEFGLGKADYLYPQKGAEFVKTSGIPGNMFNDLSTGGYLVWALSPDIKVFIDGRLEVFGEELFAQYRASIANPKTFEALCDQYSVNYVILSQMSYGSTQFMKYLVDDPRWQMIFLDQAAAIFIRDREANRSFIKQYAVQTAAIPTDWYLRTQKNLFPESPQHSMEYYNTGNFFMNVGLLNHAETSYLEALKLEPKFGEAYAMLGVLYSQKQHFQKGIQAFRRATKIIPDHAGTHFRLALMLHYHGGPPEEAEREYRKVISLEPSFAEAYTHLGLLYMTRLNQPRNAAKYFSNSLELKPAQPDAEKMKAYIKKIKTFGKNL